MVLAEVEASQVTCEEGQATVTKLGDEENHDGGYW